LGEVEFPLSFSKINLGHFTENKITSVVPAYSIYSLVFVVPQSLSAACVLGTICRLALEISVPTSWFEKFPKVLLLGFV